MYRKSNISIILSVIIVFLSICIKSFANNNFRSVKGLEYMNISSVSQEDDGEIWIGTTKGLYSFDGYELNKIHIEGLSGEQRNITDLCFFDKYLFIGSRGGLKIFNSTTQKVEIFVCTDDLKYIFENSIKYFVRVSDNLLLVFLYGKCELISIDLAKRSLDKMDTSSIDNFMNNTKIKVIGCEHGIFLCFDNYIRQYRVLNGKLVFVNKYNTDEIIDNGSDICYIQHVNNYLYIRTLTCIYRCSFENGKLSFDSYGKVCFREFNSKVPGQSKGIFLVDPNRETLYCKYDHGMIKVDNPFGSNPIVVNYSSSLDADVVMPTSFINSLFIDNSSNLWLLTRDYGLMYESLADASLFCLDIPHTNGLSNNNNFITGIEEDNKKNVWISTHLGDLYIYDYKKVAQVSDLNVESIQGLRFDKSKDELYIALPYGLIAYDIESGTIRNLVGNSGTCSKEKLNITSIEVDNYGNIWFGTWNKGLYCINERRGTFTKYSSVNIERDDVTGMGRFNWVSQIYFDKGKDDLLVCTDNGLLKLKLDKKGNIESTTLYNTSIGNIVGLKSNFINCIDKESDNIYWIGTSGGGMGKVEFHEETCSVVAYNTENGYNLDNVEQILVGKNGNIWLGSDMISCFDPKTGEILGYGNSSIKPMASAVCLKGSKYYMSGRKLIIFDDNDTITPKENTVKLLDLYIHNNRIIPGNYYDGRIIMNEKLNNVGKIHLSHKQRSFSITFSTLDYCFQENIRYRYKLSGYENEWHINSGSNNRIDYSNIPYGDYSLMLQVSYDNGYSWVDNVKTLRVVTDSPWWWCWWSISLYAGFAFFIVSVLAYLAVSKMKVKQQLVIKSLEKQKDEEVNRLRMRFFTNISHEFKTPLTLICLGVEQLEKKISMPEFEIIKCNSRNLLKLITELLDFRKSDLGIDKLNVSYNSICKQVESIYNDINIWGRKKGLVLSLNYSEDIKMSYDYDKIGHIINNLYSNAIKSVKAGGRIDVDIRLGRFNDIKYKYTNTYMESNLEGNEMSCLISFQDTGIGISGESISKIFNRYFQLNYRTDNHLGSGIGLALVKNWVLLHKGAIGISSERNIGTEIIIAIPLNIEAECSMSDNVEILDDNSDLNTVQEEVLDLSEKTEQNSDVEKPLLLIVEDSEMLLEQMKLHYMKEYNVICATNGLEGYRLCEENYPDLIITDVMMPELSGVEMCKKIRENLKIAYIPVIILTAKSEVNDQIQGYESGADMYIPKPFSFKLLDLNVARILSYHLNGPKKAESSDETEEQCDNVSGADKEFMSKLDRFIMCNIERSEFSVNDICIEMAMGKTKLYTKVKELYGVSLGELIKNVRLERAEYLLLNTDMQINEIAYAVGYETNSHFSKIFKIKHGLTPSEYIKNKNRK